MGNLISRDEPTAMTSNNYSVKVEADAIDSSNPLVSPDSPPIGERTFAVDDNPSSKMYPNDLSRQSANSSNICPHSHINSSNSRGTSGNDDEFKFQIFDTFIYPLTWIGYLCDFGMIVGCVLPYVPQYITIYKTRNCGGFSTFVCLTLLVANIMRIAYWFGERFEIPLLIQSGVMLLAQILLLELCVRVKPYSRKKSFLTSSPKDFWRWTDLISYLEFLCLFSLLMGVSMFNFRCQTIFVETIGYSALLIESMLGLPQVIKNFERKSVEGMSVGMVLMWLAGDSYKSIYFILKGSPYPFWLGGFLQMSFDVLILVQVCLYRPKSSREEKCSREMMRL